MPPFTNAVKSERPEKQMAKRVCKWCNKEMGEKEVVGSGVTEGICKECHAKEIARLKKPADYDNQVNSYVETLNKSKAGELPKWGDQTQFEVAMEDLKNLAGGNWEAKSKLEPSGALSQVAEHYHKGWKKEDFANLYDDILKKTKED